MLMFLIVAYILLSTVVTLSLCQAAARGDRP